MRCTKPLRRVIGTLTGPAIIMRRLGGLGRALGDAAVGRTWITSKLWILCDPEHVPSLWNELWRIYLGCPDLFLIHFPIALTYVPFETRYPPEWVYDPGRRIRPWCARL